MILYFIATPLSNSRRYSAVFQWFKWFLHLKFYHTKIWELNMLYIETNFVTLEIEFVLDLSQFWNWCYEHVFKLREVKSNSNILKCFVRLTCYIIHYILLYHNYQSEYFKVLSSISPLAQCDICESICHTQTWIRHISTGANTRWRNSWPQFKSTSNRTTWSTGRWWPSTWFPERGSSVNPISCSWRTLAGWSSSSPETRETSSGGWTI